MREKFNEAISRGTALATTIAAVVSCSFEIAKVEFPPDSIDGGRSSDLMNAGGNDLPQVWDMITNFDRAVGDALASEDQGGTAHDGGVEDLVYTDLVTVADLSNPDMFNFMNCLHTGSDINFKDNGGHIDQTCSGKALICECPKDPQKDAGVYTVHACPGECAE